MELPPLPEGERDGHLAHHHRGIPRHGPPRLRGHPRAPRHVGPGPRSHGRIRGEQEGMKEKRAGETTPCPFVSGAHKKLFF
jgi:hypothetical protein